MTLVSITADQPFREPPRWALLERQLIELMNRAVDPLLDKYVRPDGTIMWPTAEDHTGIDALDDAYESFHNFPLFYLLGGASWFLDLSHKEFDTITKQFTRYDSGHGHPMVVKEYEQGYDWFHQGEGYLFFYLLCMADPSDSRNVERARRYAGFYLNEDPEALNYDERVNILKCAHTGSMGPAHRNFTGEPWGYQEWMQWFGIPFLDVPGVETYDDLKDPDKAARMGKAVQERMSRGDVAVNLAATTMAANAYLLTGESKYKEWVGTYLDGWVERTERNNGILPDNVGLNGEIGEHIGGKWYGGYYGWTWPHGWVTVGDAAAIASQNGLLLFRDPRYLELTRTQLRHLIERGIERDGKLYIPHKHGEPDVRYRYDYPGALRFDNGDLYGEDGWFEYIPMDPKVPAVLWTLTLDDEDLGRLAKISQPEERKRVVPAQKKDQGGHDAAWVSYLQGEFPDYPEQILLHNVQQVYDRLRTMREDTQDPATYRDWYLQVRNPLTMEGLMQLTLGAPLPIYNGGLAVSPILHFDLQQDRPGLPGEVGALVESLRADGLTLRLANLSATATREMAIQAGSFGEHRFTSIRYGKSGEEVVETLVEAARFRVELLPGSEIVLEIGLERLVNEPAYRTARE